MDVRSSLHGINLIISELPRRIWYPDEEVNNWEEIL